MRARDIALDELKVAARDHYQHLLNRLQKPLYSAWGKCVLATVNIAALAIVGLLHA